MKTLKHFFNIFLFINFFPIYKNAETSTQYYKKTKERLQKRLLKGIKVFLRKKARIWSQAI